MCSSDFATQKTGGLTLDRFMTRLKPHQALVNYSVKLYVVRSIAYFNHYKPEKRGLMAEIY